jgi:HEPN domain-containing protein
MKTIQEHAEYWLESAEENLKSSEHIFNGGNYDWCLFIGHLVLEFKEEFQWIKSQIK